MSMENRSSIKSFMIIYNNFRRNAEDIRKNEIKKRQTRLLNENQSLPGLWIGIIGK